MPSPIDSKAKRDRLGKRREPYWHKVILGGYVGYRVGSKGGTWIARYRDEDGKQHYKSLDLPHHYAMNEFDSAVGEAKKWFDAQQQGFSAKPGTVQEAAENYVEYLRQEKGDAAAADAQGRLNRYVLPQFGKKPLDKLRLAEVRKWFHAFVVQGSDEEVRKSKASANRNLTTFKAMLNLAFHEDQAVTTDIAWKSVKRFRKQDGAREDFLNIEQVKMLLENTDGSFHALVKAAVFTGARYGELCKLTVKDLDKSKGLLNIPYGKTGARAFPLTKAAKTFFVKQAKNKLPDAPLLAREGAKPWRKGDQIKLMREAVKAAGLPCTVVFYTLRHSFIADVIDKNMNVFDIAKISGTSIQMIEDHYGKLFKDRVTEVLERSSLVQ